MADEKVMEKSIQELFLMVSCTSYRKWNFDDGIGPVIGIGLGKFRYHQDSVHAKFAKKDSQLTELDLGSNKIDENIQNQVNQEITTLRDTHRKFGT